MPLTTLVVLLLIVIALAGMTIALATASGLTGAVSVLALVAAVVLRLR